MSRMDGSWPVPQRTIRAGTEAGREGTGKGSSKAGQPHPTSPHLTTGPQESANRGEVQGSGWGSLQLFAAVTFGLHALSLSLQDDNVPAGVNVINQPPYRSSDSTKVEEDGAREAKRRVTLWLQSGASAACAALVASTSAFRGILTQPSLSIRSYLFRIPACCCVGCSAESLLLSVSPCCGDFRLSLINAVV